MVIALLLASALAASAPSAAQAPVPCQPSDDPTYAYSPENPVQIGGGPMYVKARETRYLNALRGPNGEPIRYTRSQPVKAQGDRITFLDVYEVSFDGLEKPVTLYLDAYHYWEQRAPRGFTCGEPVQLQPMLDPMLALDSLRSLADEQRGVQSFAPIPLQPGGSFAAGAMWDAFRLLVMGAEDAKDPGAPAGSSRSIGTVVVAYPLSCEGRAVRPKAVALTSARSQPLPPARTAAGDDIEKLLPGMTPPAHSIAALFGIEHPRAGDRIRITYDEPTCDDDGTESVLPVVFTGARGVEMPEGALPPGADPTQRRILMQAVIDTAGAFTQATYVGGPAHLKDAAVTALRRWRAEPARLNGIPVPTSILLEVRFK